MDLIHCLGCCGASSYLIREGQLTQCRHQSIVGDHQQLLRGPGVLTQPSEHTAQEGDGIMGVRGAACLYEPGEVPRAVH